MMQIERLVKMVFYIVDHGHVTAKELSERFQVSTRTIYRDMDALTLAGIPVVLAKGTGGGISMIDGYTIDRSLLSKEEQQSIFHGLQILQATKFPDAEMALSKIGAVFRNALAPRWIEVELSHWGSDEKEKVKMTDLQHAILNKHVITFSYIGQGSKRSQRSVEPLRLVFRSHAWYIIGYCRTRSEIRTFRLSRIRDLKIQPEIFMRELPPDDPCMAGCKEECDLPVLKLRFSPEVTYRLYDEFQEDQVCAGEDGCHYVTARYELNDWTCHYLLSFGKYVEVIEPEEARTMLRERAADIVKIYT